MNRKVLIAPMSLAAGTIGPIAAYPAHAVDNIESSDAPDLTTVRAKIDTRDYAGALAELRGLGNQNGLLHFEKDLAIAGGMFALAVAGAGHLSLDRILADQRHRSVMPDRA